MQKQDMSRNRMEKDGRERQRLQGCTPDVGALPCVGVHGVDPANRADRRAVLRHVQMVPSLGESRWLISIEHHDPDCCLVLKGTFP